MYHELERLNQQYCRQMDQFIIQMMNWIVQITVQLQKSVILHKCEKFSFMWIQPLENAHSLQVTI